MPRVILSALGLPYSPVGGTLSRQGRGARMADGLFVTPSIRRPGRATQVTHSDEVGTTAPWPGAATPAAIDDLLIQLSGVIRGLHLAGYGVPTVRLEHDGTQLEVRLPSRTAGAHPVQPDDGLASLRTPAQFLNALFIAVEAAPLALFGPAAKLNLARPLAAPSHPDVRVVGDTAGSWAVVRCSSLGSGTLKAALLDLLEGLETPIKGRWNTVPAPDSSTPTGASFILDSSRWQYPPADPTARLSGAGAHVDQAWSDFSATHITGATSARDDWLHDELMIENATQSWHEWFFGKPPQFPVTEAQDAYERRLAEVGRFLDPAHLDTARGMKKLAASDVIMTMIEHGIVDPFQSIALRATPETVPESTDPCLTGVWGATASPGGTDDVVLVNQAGRYLEGYLNRRVPSSSVGHTIESWAFAMEMTVGPGPVQEFTGIAYEIESDGSTDDNSWMSLAELEDHATGVSASIGTDSTGAVPTLHFSLTGGTTYDRPFTHAGFNTHITNQLLNTTGATAVLREMHGPPPFPGPNSPSEVPALRELRTAVDQEPRKIRRDRAGTLHPHEATIAVQIIDGLLEAALAWYSASSGKTAYVAQAHAAITSGLGSEYDEDQHPPAREFSPVAYAIGRVVRAELQSQSDQGGWNTLQTLTMMANSPNDPVISFFLGFGSGGTGADQFFYEWKLTDVFSRGAQVFGGGAVGVGTIHFRRVVDGVPSTTEVSYPIHLYTFALSSSPGPEFGMDNVPTWTAFDYPADHDLTGLLGNGASMSFTSPFNVGVGPLASNVPIEVSLTPSDGSMALQGTVAGNLITVPIYDGYDYERHKDQGEKWLEVFKAARDLGARGTKIGSRLGKAAARFKPSFGGYTTHGSIGAPLTGTESEPGYVTTPADFEVGNGVSSLFPTGGHSLDQQHLRSFRQFLAGYLPLLTGPFGGVSAVGHASSVGSTTTNLLLSERRAVSVIEAVRNILGPQLGVPATDIEAIGLGESQASGGPDDNRPTDRRTDLTLEGVVTLRL